MEGSNMFKRILVAGAVSVLAISTAQAADIEAPVVFDWTGPYVGVHLGYGDPSFDGIYDSGELPDDPEDATYVDDINADGILGGLQAGYNVQMDNIVLGIEADISFTDFSGDAEDEDGFDVVEADVDFLASLRARLGFAMDTLLIYATGGLAYADGEFKVTDADEEVQRASFDIDEFGYVVGGGLEWAANETWSFRVEGLYYGFGHEEDIDGATDDADEDDFVELKDVVVVRGGVNWRF
jgi:outer membrane immunogenic protein